MAKGTQDPGLKQVANFPTNVSSATRWPNAICAKYSTQGNQVNSISVKKKTQATGSVVPLTIFYNSTACGLYQVREILSRLFHSKLGRRRHSVKLLAKDFTLTV